MIPELLNIILSYLEYKEAKIIPGFKLRLYPKEQIHTYGLNYTEHGIITNDLELIKYYGLDKYNVKHHDSIYEYHKSLIEWSCEASPNAVGTFDNTNIILYLVEQTKIMPDLFFLIEHNLFDVIKKLNMPYTCNHIFYAHIKEHNVIRDYFINKNNTIHENYKLINLSYLVGYDASNAEKILQKYQLCFCHSGFSKMIVHVNDFNYIMLFCGICIIVIILIFVAKNY